MNTTTEPTSAIAISQIEILHISTVELLPHELNPRPFSERWQCRVYDDKVIEISDLIRVNGYDDREAVHIFLDENGNRKILAGHHRWCANRLLMSEGFSGSDITKCFFHEDLSPEDAAMMLVSYQGRDVNVWELAKHAYTMCIVHGVTQTDYATRTGRKPQQINKLISAQKVRDKCNTGTLSMSTVATISRAEEDDWSRLIEMAIDRAWSTQDAESYIATAKADAETEKRSAIKPNMESDDESLGTEPNDVDSGLSTDLDPLLNSDKVPATEPRKSHELEESNTKSGKSKSVDSKIAKQKKADRPVPQGFNTKVKAFATDDKFDAILARTNCAAEASFTYLPIFFDLLKDDGWLIVLCEPDKLSLILKDAEAAELKLYQKAVWDKGDGIDSLPGLLPIAHEEILIFNKMGRKSTPHISELSYPLRSVLTADVDADNAMPKVLMDILINGYTPASGKLLIPFAGQGETVEWSLDNDYQVQWLESKKTLYNQIVEMIGS